MLRTLFAWNNETLNAWTIVAGVVVGLAGMSHVRWPLEEMPHENFADRLSSPPPTAALPQAGGTGH